MGRQEIYIGEDVFEGDIGYGMFNEIDYRKVTGQNVAIVGHGAFAVENIRTCCEFAVKKVYLVCRRKNLSCPRVCSMLANRQMNPLTCAFYLKANEPMYNMIGFDPWSYYSVQSNEKRTSVMITQKARFGIGDIYFLAIYMGKCEVVVDTEGVKRLTKHCMHLVSGRNIECKAILKLLGLVGEMDNDRLMGVKELVGFWVNEDPRRFLVAEPLSVMASQMGGTSFSPGAYSWANMGIYFMFYPADFYGVLDSGMLPRHKADLSDEHTPRPAYVVDARHGTTTSMSTGMFCPGLQRKEFDGQAGFIKAIRYRMCHPLERFLAQAKEDWDYYANKFLEEGFGKDKPYPDYPYTFESTRELILKHMSDTGEPHMPSDAEDLKLG